jgi:hypothetical protein
MNTSTHFISENKTNNYFKRTNAILIQHKPCKFEYSLKQNSFDPFKSSPPNDFMAKLQHRMSVYNTCYLEDKSVDSCDKE